MYMHNLKLVKVKKKNIHTKILDKKECGTSVYKIYITYQHIHINKSRCFIYKDNMLSNKTFYLMPIRVFYLKIPGRYKTICSDPPSDRIKY